MNHENEAVMTDVAKLRHLGGPEEKGTIAVVHYTVKAAHTTTFINRFLSAS